jgi:hypothetical protein
MKAGFAVREPVISTKRARRYRAKAQIIWNGYHRKILVGGDKKLSLSEGFVREKRERSFSSFYSHIFLKKSFRY